MPISDTANRASPARGATQLMRLVVVAGQVPATGLSIQYDGARNDVDRDDLVYLPNAHGLQAVEEAVRLKVETGAMTVTVLAAGPDRTRDALRAYLAMGADEAILVRNQNNAGLDAYAVAMLICQSVRNLDYRLLLCEEESVDSFGCTIRLGPYISEMLGLPSISRVTEVQVHPGEDKVVVHRKIEHGGREIILCPLPCLLGIERGVDEPRYPTLPDSLASASKDIEVIDLEAGIPGSPRSHEEHRNLVSLDSLSPSRQRVKKGLVVDTRLTAAERMKMVMSGGQSSRSGRQTMFTGEPEMLAERVVMILESQGIIHKGG